MERRLAAILAADVVGYSRLMETDEAGTLAALKDRRRNVLMPLLRRHHGRVVKLMGDGVLVEFASAVNAVLCAVDLQHDISAANVDVPAGRRVELRIGINLGDVIVEGSDLYGDGVNVAARLESLADPGGIFLAGTVYDQVKNKVQLKFDDLGSQTVKNLLEPVRVYCVTEAEKGAVRSFDDHRDRPLIPPSKPSVVVLPFANLSGDPEQEYLSDGLTEDITRGLSRVGALFVIASNSAFTYKGHAVIAGRIAHDLGVRYVLEGSVRTSDRRIRITTRLLDTTTSHPVWAEKFDRELVEIFDLQDEITRNVVASTQTQILMAEGNATHRDNRPDIGVWGLISRAMARIYELTHGSLAEAKQLAEQALKVDANCGPAWRCLAMATFHQVLILAVGEETMSDALGPAERAVQLDPGDESAHWILGVVLFQLRHHERGIAEIERALEINPNYSTALGSLGTVLCYVGRAREGIAKNEAAIRSDPLNPAIFFRYHGLAVGHYFAGDYECAAEWARKSIQRNRQWYLSHVYLIAALAHLDRVEDAQSAREEYLSQFPHATVSELRRLPFKNAGDFERLCNDLRKAGLAQ